MSQAPKRIYRVQGKQFRHLNIKIPAGLHQTLRVYSVQHGEDIKDIVARAITAYLARR